MKNSPERILYRAALNAIEYVGSANYDNRERAAVEYMRQALKFQDWSKMETLEQIDKRLENEI